MAASVREIAEVFDDVGMSYDIASETQIVTGFDSLSNYRNPQGARALTLVVELSEGGRYFTLFAPMAYDVPDHRAALFLQACAMVQWKTKLIQFEYDADDGEVRPVVEFPLEDAPLTKAQLLGASRGSCRWRRSRCAWSGKRRRRSNFAGSGPTRWARRSPTTG